MLSAATLVALLAKLSLPAAATNTALTPSNRVAATPTATIEELETFEYPLPPPVLSLRETTPEEKDEDGWQQFIVKRGYNLAIICSRAGVKKGELHLLMQLGKTVAVLQKLYPKDRIRMKILPDGTLAGLQYDIDQSKRLEVTRLIDTKDGENPFTAKIIDRPLEIRQAYGKGIIESSLIEAAQQVNLDSEITYELIRIFGWDIDFSLDLRKGDRFIVVYEQYYRDGEKVQNQGGNRKARMANPIIAAEFINNDNIYRAIRYTDTKGNTDYYSPDGRSVRKAFMRNPVDARVTSHFNPKRRHPILNKIRAHKGVDYGAPIGTPIKAVGDGKIVFRGKNGGYGYTLIIQHGEIYSTLYAHLSRYAKNTKKGQKVKQGQTIAYVGKSGLVTGPHLHYEFRVNGVHRNPLKVPLPSVEPIPAKERKVFLAQIEEQVKQLNTLGRIELALRQTQNNKL